MSLHGSGAAASVTEGLCKTKTNLRLPCVSFVLLFVVSHLLCFFLVVVLSLFVHSVSVKLSVRSWAQDGLILLLSDSKQMDFIVLRLTGGKLMMSTDLGKGPASITSSVLVNDGHWHTVS